MGFTSELVTTTGRAVSFVEGIVFIYVSMQ